MTREEMYEIGNILEYLADNANRFKPLMEAMDKLADRSDEGPLEPVEPSQEEITETDKVIPF